MVPGYGCRVSSKGHSTYGPDPGTHYAARIQSPPDFEQFSEHAFLFLPLLPRFHGAAKKAILSIHVKHVFFLYCFSAI